jgi:cytochrome b561
LSIEYTVVFHDEVAGRGVNAPRADQTMNETLAVRQTQTRTIERYTPTAIVLHWLIAVTVLGLIVWGWWMQTIPKDPVGPRVDAFNLHKSVGLAVLALMLIRLAWRAGHKPPELKAMPRWQVHASRIVHWGLYTCLVIQPLSGYLGSAFSGYPVKWFGVVLPAWATKSVATKDLMSAVHSLNSWILVALIGVHVVAALKHGLVDRDGVVRRMWFAAPPRAS